MGMSGQGLPVLLGCLDLGLPPGEAMSGCLVVSLGS